jgi:hypothetical protein
LIKRFINLLLPALVRVVYCLSLLVPVKVFIGIFLARLKNMLESIPSGGSGLRSGGPESRCQLLRPTIVPTHLL